MNWTCMLHTVTKLIGIWYCFISPDHLSNLERLKLKRMRMTNGRMLFIRIQVNEIIPYHNIFWFQIYGYCNTVLFQYITINNRNIYYTVYFYIQEIHGGAGLISRIEYLTYIVEFETIHTEDLPSDRTIRLTIIDYGH